VPAASIATASSNRPCAASTYVRRTPETTSLHIVVREHLETFLATVREQREKPLPRYVEDELRRYLRCGILAHGFCRVACWTCGKEILVGYACKCRGSCPSCSARRMCGSAAHLVDRVLPDVPVRQWVLTAPYEVRRLLALRPDALSACNRIFVSEIARWQKNASGLSRGETGSITFVQRFNATLGSFVHFHVVALDGVVDREDDGEVVFHPGRAPSRDEIAVVAARVHQRMRKWLRRRKLIDDRPVEERSNETPELSPIELCMQLSLSFSADATFVRLDGAAATRAETTELGAFGDDHTSARNRNNPWVAEVEGFNVHAGVTVRAGDRDALERLCRYGARPPFSLERISRIPDGRVAYRLRKPRKNGTTHLVLTPMQFLARIAALIPPPRFPLLRFAGVLAPNSALRPHVVSMRAATQGDDAAPRAANDERKNKKKKKKATRPSAAEAPIPKHPDGARHATRTHATSLATGVVPQCYARIDWASLLRRIYLEDVLACPCGGRRRIVAEVTERDTIVAILHHLGIDTEPPRLARARDPTEDAA